MFYRSWVGSDSLRNRLFQLGLNPSTFEKASLGAFAALSADGRVVTWGEERTGGDSRIFHSQLVEVGGTHTQNARKTEVFHLIRRKRIPLLQYSYCILFLQYNINFANCWLSMGITTWSYNLLWIEMVRKHAWTPMVIWWWPPIWVLWCANWTFL